MVMLFILGRVDQRYLLLAGQIPYLADGWIIGQLLAVTAAELVPARRVVPEPFAQVGAGGGVLDPFPDRRAVLFEPARPEPVDQHAQPVTIVGGRIGALERQLGFRHASSPVAT